LGKLANVEKMPILADLLSLDMPDKFAGLQGHHLAHALLKDHLVLLAWKALLEN
jgi:hypothetical protein